MSRHHMYEIVIRAIRERMAGAHESLLIQASLLRMRHSPAFEARMGQGLCSTRWNGLYLFIIYWISFAYRVISVMNT
jgi:hypothetical protein